MIKVRVIKKFQFNEYERLKNIQRKSVECYGWLFIDDVFECDKQVADYLMGENDYKEKFVKVIEVKPEKKTSK